MKLPAAKTMNYWKSGGSAPGAVLSKAVSEIHKAGGQVLAEAWGTDPMSGCQACTIRFRDKDDRYYKVVWPVLPHEPNNETDARRQAATMLYHDCKVRSIRARVFGLRVAYFEFAQLADGRIAAQLADQELDKSVPLLCAAQVDQ